jgi:hypothetical protein
LSASGRPDSPDTVPMEFSAELRFPEGLSASFYCSFLTENQQWANVSGSKGFVHLRSFVLPFYGGEAGFDVTNAVLDVRGSDFNMHDRTRRVSSYEYSNNYAERAGNEVVPAFRRARIGRPSRPVLGRNRVEDAESARCVPPVRSARRQADRTVSGRDEWGGRRSAAHPMSRARSAC